MKRCIEVRQCLPVLGVLDEIVELDDDVADKVQKLQIEIFSLMNSSIKTPRQASRSSAPLKSIGDRLRGKDGRIRGNLMGKRVNHSARSVISPDVHMDVDELGVPEVVATVLTVPERVTAGNVDALERRVHVGANKIDGADSVITNNGTVVSLEHCKARKSIRLQHGWIVLRYLQNGDPVIFNRQPSLHKMSMMAHRAHIVQGSTFRLHLSVVSCYNADFDGDEMNLHVPQSHTAMLEAKSIMSVAAQLISPASNKPCIAINQDALLGMYVLTLPSTVLSPSVVMRLVGWLRYPFTPWHAIRVTEDWSGRRVASLLFPPRFCYTRGSGAERVVIRNGQLLEGTLGKSVLGSSSQGLVDCLYRDFGVGVTMHFLSDVQRLTKEFLLTRGFAVGISDCIVKDAPRVRACVQKAVQSVEAIQTHDLVHIYSKQAEAATQSILSKTLMNVSSLVNEGMGDDNAIKHLVTSGSKGNSLNLSQIAGCVGQQTVEGGRTCSTSSRSLSHFAPGDTSAASRGFVSASYVSGLSPTEYFFHMMGGREGLVDTSVKTATTGYLQRRLVKAMEDNTVEYDGTVRNADGKIIEFVYGVDGYDASRIEKMDAKCMHWTDAQMEAYVGGGAYLQTCLALRDVCWKRRVDHVLVPLHVVRMLDMERPSLDALGDAERTVVRLLDVLRDEYFKFLVAVHMAPQQLQARGLSAAQVEALCKRIEVSARDAIVDAGEAVGCLAAQSIGESGTQMTLNSFHSSGMCHSHLVYGIPRFKALIDLSHVTGSMRLMVPTAEAATETSRSLVHVRLVDVVLQTTFLHDPDDTAVDADELMLKTHAVVYGRPAASAWCARMRLNKTVMQAQGMTPQDVFHALQCQSSLHWCASDCNALEWTLRMRAAEGAEKHAVEAAHTAAMCTRLRGVPSISHAWTSEVQVPVRPGEERTGWVVETTGMSLLRASLCEHVDLYNSTLNHVHEAYRVFGIEVCAAVLYHEIHACITHDGTYLDPRHLAHVTNTMCFRAEPMSFTRHGINRVEQSAHLQFGFEETQKLISDAAMFSKVDAGCGVTQSVIFGQAANVGTGKFETRIPLTAPYIPPPVPPPRRLCKSRVRVTESEPEIPNIEFVDSRVWRPRQVERPTFDRVTHYVPPSP